MLQVPYDIVIKKIKEQAALTDDEIDAKIRQKMDQLIGLVSKEGAAHIIANEFGVKLLSSNGKVKINEIYHGMTSVEIVGKVTRRFELREFDKGERKGKVASFFVADETGQIRVTLWNEQTDGYGSLKEGDIVRIVDAKVRLNNGFKELHLDTNSSFVINPPGIAVNGIKAVNSDLYGTRKKISELKAGEQGIDILCTIVDVYGIRFFEVCPNCGKRLIQKGGAQVCEVHNEVQPGYSCVLNLVLDDGSGTIRAVFFRRQIKNLLKKEEKDIMKYRDSPEAFEAEKNDILGEIVRVVGRTATNTFFNRLEFIVSMVFPDVNPEMEIKRLEPRLEPANDVQDA